jgi:hypothetical protein
MKTTDAKPSLFETAAALYCAIQRLTEQEQPQDPLFTINNSQLIANFDSARVAFHDAMGARPNVRTAMSVPQSGDLKACGERLMQAVTSLAIVIDGIAIGKGWDNSWDRAWEAQQTQQKLPKRRSEYRLALEAFGTALGHPVNDPEPLTDDRNESDLPLYFD